MPLIPIGFIKVNIHCVYQQIILLSVYSEYFLAFLDIS